MAAEERIVRFMCDGPNDTICEREFIAKDKGGGFVEGVEVGVFLNFKRVPLPNDLFNKTIYPCHVINRNVNGKLSEVYVYSHGPAMEQFTPGRVLTSQDNEFIRLKSENLQQKHHISTLTYHTKSVSGDDQFHKRVGIETSVWGKADKSLRPVVVLDKHFGRGQARND